MFGFGAYASNPKMALACLRLSAGSTIESPPGEGVEDKFASSVVTET